ncbi:CHASE2 domain-containing protein [Geomonas sp. RF6]|uniref:CHASE2 domain-containing protein n=1 Tax=Geomonas sp. RF6 TaxID=2897342 RepID=UPI001E2C5B12|nr:CHASE2 domain-containing protein [Geomonas sp. RF6]UFS70491.1 CHASE2 domain-containing protein [Geomonas sp. RF6]
MHSSIKDRRRELTRIPLLLSIGLGVTVLAALIALYNPAHLAHLEDRFFDLEIAAGPPATQAPPPAVVAVDDEALALVGRWPWPRSEVARLLKSIAAQKPAVIAIDALFPERERIPGENAAVLSPGDRELAAILCRGPFVLGYEFTFGAREAPRGRQVLHPLPVVTVREKGGADPAETLWHPTGAVASLPEFAGCARSGFVNAAMEHGGILRRMPVVMAREGRLFPSLALAAVLKGKGSGGISFRSTWSGERILQLGSERVPLDSRGRLLLRYREYGGVKPISAAALLQGRVPPDILRGRIVFVGATATGMGEAVATPLEAMLSGVQVHATAADNIMRGDLVRESPWVWRILLVLALGGCATLLPLFLPALRGALVLGAIAFAAWSAGAWLLRSHGILLGPVFPIVVLGVNFSLLTVLRTVYLEKGVEHQGHDLVKARDLVMTSLASLTEIRDMETGAHVLRCQRYLHILCEELRRFPRFGFLDQETIELVSKLAPLHDIGKVGLPDQLLRKASGFTREEYDLVKKHTIFGRDAIAKAAARVGIHDDELIRYAKEIIYTHHERWDGSGYPQGLAGDDIPWVGRAMALVDAYDAMVTQRVYNKPITHDDAVKIMMQGKGKLFDPDVVDAFLCVQEKWQRVVQEIRDEDEL